MRIKKIILVPVNTNSHSFKEIFMKLLLSALACCLLVAGFAQAQENKCGCSKPKPNPSQVKPMPQNQQAMPKQQPQPKK